MTTVEHVGKSLADIADDCGYAESDGAYIRSGGEYEWEYIPFENWHLVYPKASDGEPNFMFTPVPQDNGTGRSVFALITAVIVAVVAPYLLPVLGSFGTALTLTALSAGLAYAGNKLFPVADGAKRDKTSKDPYSQIGSDANVIARGIPIPRVCNRRLPLPEACQPRYRMLSGKQTIDRVFVLYGEHEITDIEVEDTAITSIPEITVQIRDGSDGTTTYLTNPNIDKIAAFTSIGQELKGFRVEDGTNAEDTSVPTNDEPQVLKFTTAGHPRIEEVVIRLQISNMVKTTDTSIAVRLPIRLAYTPKGGSKIYLPVIHFIGRSVNTEIVEVRVRSSNSPDFGLFETGGEISTQFFNTEPAVTAYDLTSGNTGVQWEADAWFTGAGGITDVTNIEGRRGQIRVIHDGDLSEFEWEIQRGLGLKTTDINTSTYENFGNVVSLFEFWKVGGTWEIPIDQTDYPAAIAVLHAGAVADEHPVQLPGTAVVGIRSIGHPLNSVTAHADGVVWDWSGSAWETRTTSNNPATWFYNILLEWLTETGVDTSLIDSDSIVAWRQECVDQGYELSAIFDGVATDQALMYCLEAGFARMAFDHGFGVDWFRDRSAERPKMVLSPRNTTDISFKIVDDEPPQSVRVTFGNEDDRWVQDEMTVNNPFPSAIGLQESVETKAISNENLIRRRKVFDFASRHYRRRIWSVSTFMEHVGFAIGDMIGVVTDIVNDDSTGFRVTSVLAPNIIEIDQYISVGDVSNIFEVGNFFTIGDIFNIGLQSVVFLTTDSGTVLGYVEGVEGRVLTLDNSTDVGDAVGVHGVVGPLGRYTRRCYVVGIEPDEDNNATVTLIDEAVKINEYMSENFA